MGTKISLPVIHPAFELLRSSARVLHFVAASVIILNAFHQLQIHPGQNVICYAQIIIAINILIMVFFGSGLISDAPIVNMIFRMLETLVLMGISWNLNMYGHEMLALFHLMVTIAYAFILYREIKMYRSESVEISLTGISIPDFVIDKELSWCDIKTFVPKYHSIYIETVRNKRFRFKLRKNLKLEELEQIHDFCRQNQQVIS